MPYFTCFNYTERLILQVSRFQNALFYIFQGIQNALFYKFQGIQHTHYTNMKSILSAKENSVYFATKPIFCRS